jgi:hypothetical protein
VDGIEDSRTTGEQDEAIEAAVLLSLIAFHPGRMTAEELVREIAGSGPGFGERDAVGRAVRDLAAAGLVHRDGSFVEPTRAALRFSRLLDR